jgi:hypothetical protein
MTNERREAAPPEHENKYVFSRTRLTPLLRWLEHVCRPDGDHPFGIVSSIYYDTREWDSLGEKLNSDYLKTKIRLRWYAEEAGDGSGDPAFAEVKYRIGSRRAKVRIPTSLTAGALEALPLEDPALLDVPRVIRAHGVPLTQAFFPVFVVRYTRCRYLEGTSGARVCLDHSISAPRTNRLMLPWTNPVELNTGVFEVKSPSRELPAVLHRLVDLGLRMSSFSKYYACYRQLRRDWS